LAQGIWAWRAVLDVSALHESPKNGADARGPPEEPSQGIVALAAASSEKPARLIGQIQKNRTRLKKDATSVNRIIVDEGWDLAIGRYCEEFWSELCARSNIDEADGIR